MNKIIIIDPTAPELVRGSFCLSPYLLYSYLAEEEHVQEVAILENFTAADIQTVPQADTYLIALWSYSQIEFCRMLPLVLPAKAKKLFFGYQPLILKNNLPFFKLTDEIIKKGMVRYPHHVGTFRHILLTDGDMHIAKYYGNTYPYFTSYGCVNRCAFCPVGVNDGTRTALSVDEVSSGLDCLRGLLICNIHFMDEDFFIDIDRADMVLRLCKQRFNIVLLSTSKSLLKYIDAYGFSTLLSAQVRCIEIGMESADELLNKKMNKNNASKCIELGERFKQYKEHVRIFWLCLSFFPGETIHTLNTTGAFLSRYGFDDGELFPRIQTNSCVGGLGQFYVPYEGTKQKVDSKNGLELSPRHLRLLPTFIPQSFLDSQIERCGNIFCMNSNAPAAYGIDIEKIVGEIEVGMTVAEAALHLQEKNPNLTIEQIYIFLALLCRANIIQ